MNSKLYSPVSTATPEFSSASVLPATEPSPNGVTSGATSGVTNAATNAATDQPTVGLETASPSAAPPGASVEPDPSSAPPAALGQRPEALVAHSGSPSDASSEATSEKNPKTIISEETSGISSGAAAGADSETVAEKTAEEEEFEVLRQIFSQELTEVAPTAKASSKAVASRIAREVQRICEKSDRIQNSGDVRGWQLSLGQHRLDKCLSYYKLGSHRGRVELHSTLSTMVYRHIAPLHARLGFQGRHALIEDFLQSFYIESLKMFRRENELPENYQPRTRLQLAEYMAFTEQYAKRRVNLPGRTNQQIVILRAQSFSNRQPKETLVDIEAALEGAKRDEPEAMSHSSVARQLREHMVSEGMDPTEGVLRDRVIAQLVDYLRKEGHHDCIDYLSLRLQDLPAPEIDEILGLTARQRDYLQQRFKYHVERFAKLHQWQLVHNWLGANLSQNLGMMPTHWEGFYETLNPEQQQLVDWKRRQAEAPEDAPISDEEIAVAIGCTPKQVQKRWAKVLERAWKSRNLDHPEK